jgi:hypothetical protein
MICWRAVDCTLIWRWQYRISQDAVMTVPQGKIDTVYVCDGEPLQPS